MLCGTLQGAAATHGLKSENSTTGNLLARLGGPKPVLSGSWRGKNKVNKTLSASCCRANFEKNKGQRLDGHRKVRDRSRKHYDLDWLRDIISIPNLI